MATGGVTDRRTKVDWAEVVRKLVEEDYPDRDRIVLVMDNLNTHHPSSLYEAFEPSGSAAHRRTTGDSLHAEARELAEHGRDRNRGDGPPMPDRRIPDQSVLRREVAAWQQQRNRDAIRVDWRFTTADARIKLKSLYPSIQRLMDY